MDSKGKRKSRLNSKRADVSRANLYRLIQAVNEEVESDEDELVVSIVMNLVKCGKVKWVKYPKQLEKMLQWQ